MAISAYTGLPGAGKSYGVVENVLLPAFRVGRLVVTNILLVDEAVRKDFPKANYRVVSKDEVAAEGFIPSIEPGTLLVLDEAWRIWPQTLKAHMIPEAQRSFLAEHRHMVGEDGYNVDIVLVGQDLSQLCSFVRQLVDKTFHAVKLDALGLKRFFRVDIYQGAVTGQKPPRSRLLRSVRYKYRKRVYAYYKSATYSKTGTVGSEVAADSRASVFGFSFFAFGLFALAAIGGGAWGLERFFSGASVVPAHAATASEVHSVGASSASAAPAAPVLTAAQIVASALPPQPQDSAIWRLGGVVSSAGKMVALVVNSSNGRFAVLDGDQCHLLPGTKEWVCDWQGTRVAAWTGGVPVVASGGVQVSP